MKNLLLFLLLLTICPLSAQDQTGDGPTEEKSGNKRFWQATLPGGNYMVALDRITSISNHAYVLDGTVVVTEITIDTLGTTVARFYQITPVSEYSELNITGLLTDRLSDIADRQTDFTGMDPTTTVQKKYPLTTHAKTIEYQISTIKELSALYKSLSTSWESGRGRKFSIKK